MQTSKVIKDLREKAGFTQDDLADKLFVTRFLVSKWENGSRRPRHEYIVKMAELFSVKPEEIASINLIEELSELCPNLKDFSEDDLKNKINSFLESLSEKERNIFIMRYYYFTEIGELCFAYGMKRNAVYTMLSRTKTKLKDYFGRDCCEQ